MFRDKKKLGVALGVCLGVLIFSLVLHSTSLLDSLDRRLSNGLYGEREDFEDIVLVAIDEKSLKSLNEGGLGNFSKWTRSHYAKVIEKLQTDGAQAIFIDVIFDEASSTISLTEIAEHAQAAKDFADLGESLAGYLTEHPADQALVEALDEDVFMVKYAQESGLVNGILGISEEITSNEIFANRANNVFATASKQGNEQAIYNLPIGYETERGFEESVSLRLARDFLYGEDSVGLLSADGKWYQFDEERRIPVKDGTFLINYAQDSYSVPTISFTDLVRGNLEPGTVEGKIVMIGATAPVLQDRHFTPIDAEVPMPGVEIQANALQTVLDGQFLREQGTGGFLMLVGVMLAVGVAAFSFLPVLAGLGVLGVEILAFPFVARWMFAQGVVIDLIWPLVSVLAAYLLVMGYRNFTEFQEKRELKTAFGHYVSAELVEQISANPDSLQLGGERRTLSVLFLDIENFTSLSEALEAQEVVRIINHYFDAFANIIMAQGGTVDKFEGDAIMALFGAPVAYEDHAMRACQTAMAIRAKVGELNQEMGQQLNVRVGIATGDAVVGNMGSKTRFDYTAMGDTVNTASRLEGANKFYGTRVMVSPGTFEATQEALFYRRLDRVRLKGKTEALDVYELLGTKEGVTEQGAAVVNTWHQALEYYRNQDWDGAETRLREVLTAMPEDGPAKAYLERVAALRANPPQGWDGIWSWGKK